MPAITLLTGRAAPLPGSDQKSGIDKQPVTQPLHLGPEGLDGDEQADRRVHGGPEKAVHHYPFDHYPAWRAELASQDPVPTGGTPAIEQPGMKETAALLDAPGAFGENLSTLGMTEKTVAVGDVFRLGGALIQVSQGRQPCWKLSHRFGVPDIARRVQDSGRTGWYYRVLQPGRVAPGDRLELIDRLAPDWTLHRLWRALYVDRMNLTELQGIAGLDLLAEGWRRHARRRLESGRVEDWSKRLEGGA
ncbi:MOSC domain-containing protein YiiM [Paracoccus halophilus]|uniref:MOSC domain-containing protein YiiM n=1 Tax=Paracoccus halophilus TaxID=376733 RepID=A0A099EZ17_9RHOB|nr:MOSC domain-containing protein [Paracoccus halophilus]KGJ03695.1 molybdenum cofactor sulfurase [Paracoccus halophilus]SFA57244.1 MOSC domain-containing protein YiiM [Paracoccus halophilus]